MPIRQSDRDLASSTSPVALATPPGLKRLRFPDALERDFIRDYERDATTSRATLMGLAMALIALTPLYDARLLRAPADFLELSHLLQFVVEIPIIAIGLIITLVPRLRSASRVAALIGMVVVAFSIAAQRAIGLPVGFEVPADFPAITIAATLFAGRLRLRELALPALFTMAGTTSLMLAVARDSASLYGLISSWMLFALALVGAALLEHAARESWYRGRLLEQLAVGDALTGLPNRRYFDSELRTLLRLAIRERRRVALALLDIDHFKAFNDYYGHPLGDECLRQVGARLKTGMRRPRDFCARVGGEEFAAIWYDADAAASQRLAEHLRGSVDALSLPPAPGHGQVVTASAGFAEFSPADLLGDRQSADDADIERLSKALIHAADDALYEAKRAGRARLVARTAVPAA